MNLFDKLVDGDMKQMSNIYLKVGKLIDSISAQWEMMDEWDKKTDLNKNWRLKCDMQWQKTRIVNVLSDVTGVDSEEIEIILNTGKSKTPIDKLKQSIKNMITDIKLRIKGIVK